MDKTFAIWTSSSLICFYGSNILICVLYLLYIWVKIRFILLGYLTQMSNWLAVCTQVAGINIHNFLIWFLSLWWLIWFVVTVFFHYSFIQTITVGWLLLQACQIKRGLLTSILSLFTSSKDNSSIVYSQL